MSASFWPDLKQSHIHETRFAQALEAKGFTITLDQSTLKTDWDVHATLPDNTTPFTFEVKHDRYAGVLSNNVAVEVMKQKDDRWQLCGIHTTEATFMTYTFTNDPDFYIVETSTLRDMHVSSAFERIVNGGDRRGYKCMLIDFDRFKAMAKKLSPAA